jgi:hypothetical protein
MGQQLSRRSLVDLPVRDPAQRDPSSLQVPSELRIGVLPRARDAAGERRGADPVQHLPRALLVALPQPATRGSGNDAERRGSLIRLTLDLGRDARAIHEAHGGPHQLPRHCLASRRGSGYGPPDPANGTGGSPRLTVRFDDPSRPWYPELLGASGSATGPRSRSTS